MCKFLIVATPRSATAYTSALLSSLGLNCGHERYFSVETRLDEFRAAEGPVGECSWLAVPFLKNLPEDVAILHQTRDPLKVVRSMLELQMFDLDAEGRSVRQAKAKQFTEFALAHCPQVLEHANELDRCAWFYYYWNRKIEEVLGQRCRLQYAVERLDPPLLRQVLDAAGLDAEGFSDDQLAGHLASVPRNVNAKAPDKVMLPTDVSWAALPEEVRELARTYGYEPADSDGHPARSGPTVAAEDLFEPIHEHLHTAELAWRDEREQLQMALARAGGASPPKPAEQRPCDAAFGQARQRVHEAQRCWREERAELEAQLATARRETTDLRTLGRELQAAARALRYELKAARDEAKRARAEREAHWSQRTEQLQARVAELTERERAGRERHAALQNEHGKLAAGLEVLKQKLARAEQTAELEREKAARLAQLSDAVSELRRELGSAQAQHTESQRLLEKSTAETRRLNSQRKVERALRLQQQQRADRLTRDLQRVEAELRLLREEVRYRLGDALVRALRPSKDTLLLPFRLIKLFRDGLARRMARRRKRIRRGQQAAGTSAGSPTTAERSTGVGRFIADGGASRAGNGPAARVPEQEKISVIMTAYNSEAHAGQAIESILNQTHRNIELIVVDDASTDETPRTVQDFATRDARVRLIRCFQNHGTYWCKNLALIQAAGTYVAFQDSDDISAPERLALQLAKLKQHPQAVACRCQYVRKNERGELIMNRGVAERRALIGILFEREPVLQEVGFFDSVRTSADEEHYRRLQLAFSEGGVVPLDQPLYTALYRDGSLTTDPENRSSLAAAAPPDEPARGDQADSPSFLSPARREYVEAYEAWHARVRAGADAPHIQFPLRRRPFPAPAELLPGDDRVDDRITASMASIPSRVDALRQVVEAILPQVDQLDVFLNHYDEVPDFLQHPKIRYARSQDHGDQRDNGKFFFVDEVQGYHLTIDDDIHYPPDYVQRCLLKLMQYGHRVAIGAHGVILAEPLQNFLEGRRVFHFREATERDRLVNLVGTGTVAYHTSTLRLRREDFGAPGMADLWFALAAKRQAVPLVGIGHPARWMEPIPVPGVNLFEAFAGNDDLQTTIAKREAPWALEALIASFADDLAPLIEWLHTDAVTPALTTRA